ncbi:MULTISPECIES: 50S ribosomal protein L21 [Aminobacterium]|jgi:large subunit ribosomal protein L21|uniref:Large ribosomal subunit protein bL21 n=1 Tax=Aminobacterium colombiense (strain DSM 12261 / ALA-1) TaxID=572547 RepID=D5EEJ6_AMICL|nr:MULTISPECIES: 50S ribosomal protein L21 [Aminobacterium]MDD2378854.1 50S ribosomal protein L21 [Aminobacterium colombiense]ADE56978.1 ribosomal protein L21 [Aminobacterium colombiense DSM 12261]MDD3767604.1 50S ribosomal protein L21 [Aminobacterium colombiense]MDD4266032.1 50S ribosomal protein L21 [Aminobacterium colombiense]MDD4585626.1 50S ribosomal protein L21 [Aminobacterium colombiense]
MYAIVETGGKQYRVESGDVVRIESLHVDEGASLVFDKILMVSNDSEVQVGTPYLSDATVNATVVRHGRAPKILVFKYKSKKNYRRMRGHRQNFTEVKIDSINA